MSVLAITVAVTALQFPVPAVRPALGRDAVALAAGQWWRLVTALFVQYDPWWQIIIVFALIAGIGAVTERVFGPGRWLLLYVGCGVVGQAFGFRWQPYDAGASVAGVAPSTVTGIGAGTLLTGFALAALAGVHTQEMPPLRSTDRPV